jgi:hypothetical protein
MSRYWKAQIDEIAADPALRFYGACLGLAHLLCFIKWRRQASVLSDGGVCWPFFEDCFRYRILDAGQVDLVLWGFGAAALVSVVLFLLPPHFPADRAAIGAAKGAPRTAVCAAYWWMVLLNVFKTLIYVQDYRLRMNQHYMLYAISAAFLFLPNKRHLLRYTMVAFYVWASTLKYNREWLSGDALHGDNPLWIPDALIPLSCLYALILESFISWGTLSGRRWLAWASFGQLVLFHVVSWTVVGFFYPLLMFCLLAIFPLTYVQPHPAEPRSLLASFWRGAAPRGAYAWVAFFSCLQLVPVIIPGDEKLTGEGRIFSLHMIDAFVACEGAITVKFEDGSTERLQIPDKSHPIRTRCEPAFNFSVAKRICYERGEDARFADLDLAYRARRSGGTLRPLVAVKDFCAQDLSYDLWRPNDWILK